MQCNSETGSVQVSCKLRLTLYPKDAITEGIVPRKLFQKYNERHSFKVIPSGVKQKGYSFSYGFLFVFDSVATTYYTDCVKRPTFCSTLHSLKLESYFKCIAFQRDSNRINDVNSQYHTAEHFHQKGVLTLYYMYIHEKCYHYTSSTNNQLERNFCIRLPNLHSRKAKSLYILPLDLCGHG